MLKQEAPFPWRFDGRGRTASPTYAEHVREMIELVLLTAPGERVNRPDFGSGLNQLVFAPNSPELAAALQFAVQGALQHWLGDVIRPLDLTVEAADSTLAVTLHYVLLDGAAEETVTVIRTE